MPVASMTGFARYEGQLADAAFVWELRSLNGKGLEARFRLPQGLEFLEADLRKLAAARLVRGSLQIALTLSDAADRPRFVVNEAVLADILELSDRLVAAGHAVTPTADGLLSIKGVLEIADRDAPALDAIAERRGEILAGFSAALDALVAAREAEGEAIAAVLRQRLAEMTDLINRAEHDPARHPAAIGERLKQQVALLLQAGGELDEQRLHAEAILLATRADIREELDRLRVHLGAADKLLIGGGPIGRRLDFLSQEFNRETNTICSKSNATSVTAIGLDLKVAVDRFREQVQNIE